MSTTYCLWLSIRSSIRVPLSRWTFFVEDTMRVPSDAFVVWESSASPFRPNTPELEELRIPEADPPVPPATAEVVELAAEPTVAPAVLPTEPAAAPPANSTNIAQVNQSTAAVLDRSTAAVLDGNVQYAAFGHGTMVMGVIHLVAPQARLLPLKAFRSDGTGYLSDILRELPD